jgi:hypothetical protein
LTIMWRRPIVTLTISDNSVCLIDTQWAYWKIFKAIFTGRYDENN